VGTGTVIVVDGRTLEINHIGYVDNRQPFALTNVRYSLLTPGMVYDLKRRMVVDPGPIAPPASVLPLLEPPATDAEGPPPASD
jgi:cyanophycinase